MGVMHRGNRLYKTRIVMRKHAKHFHAHVNSFSRAQTSFLCACKSLYYFSFFSFRDSIINKSIKKTEKINIFPDDCTIYQI